jgi:hypothetical protein
MAVRYLDGLATTLSSAIVPYGYALVVWTSGALAQFHHGTPHPKDVVAFAAGAVVAYGVLRVLSRNGDTQPPRGLVREGLVKAGAIHVAAIAGAVAVAWAAARVGGAWGWFLPVLCGSAVYFVGTALDEALKLSSED